MQPTSVPSASAAEPNHPVEPTPTVDVQLVRQNLRAAYSQLNYLAFCTLLDLDPRYDTAKGLWVQFCAMCECVSRFDNQNLSKLFNYQGR